MERGGQVALNLRALYEYMMHRLTLANATNDQGRGGGSGRPGLQDQERLGSNRHGFPMSGAARRSLEQAVDLSHRLLAAADESNMEQVAILDAERLRLLQSAGLDRDSLSEEDRQMLRQVSELNDRAIGLVEHQRRIKGTGDGFGRGGPPRGIRLSTTRSQR